MRVHGILPARFVATCAAVILLGSSAFASGTYVTRHPASVAQEAASPSPVPTETPLPAGTPIDLKQGGITGNSNGPNWLDKFNRAPGPDTSGSSNAAPAMKTTAPMKCKNMKTKKPMPCKKSY